MDLINNYKKESLHLKNEIADICYFMRGGINWDQAWGISYEDRVLLISMINKRLKEQDPNSKEYM